MKAYKIPEIDLGSTKLIRMEIDNVDGVCPCVTFILDNGYGFTIGENVIYVGWDKENPCSIPQLHFKRPLIQDWSLVKCSRFKMPDNGLGFKEIVFYEGSRVIELITKNSTCLTISLNSFGKSRLYETEYGYLYYLSLKGF